HERRARRGNDTAPSPRALSVRLRPCRDHRSVATWERRELVAARPDGGRDGQGPVARRIRGPRVRFGRGPLDAGRGQRRGRARTRPRGGAVRAVCLARRGGLSEPCAVGHAARIRRTPGEGMTRAQVSDALVLYGITGDLAFKKIFPALQALV